jgi:LysM repeat protein
MVSVRPQVVSKSSSLTTTSYTVVAGDTLFNIAKRFGIELQALYDANPQLNGSTFIVPGQVLSIPGQPDPTRANHQTAPKTYTVQPGDTLSKIAQSFGITLQALRDANLQLQGKDLIVVGQILSIPAAVTTTTYTVVAGDTLWKISQNFGITLQALRDANPQLGGTDLIVPGQLLTIPTAVTTTKYTVQPGDTLWKISQSFGIELQALRDANPQLQGRDLIVPGQVLVIPAGGTGHPPHPPPPTGGVVHYSGPASAFPPLEKWVRFSALWNQNAPTMKQSNLWPGNTEEQDQIIHEAIIQVASESGIDQCLILAVVMQESQGHVHIPTTNNGVRNPGLMQSHNGVEYSDSDPRGSIFQMVRDGTEGTADGDGLVQLVRRYGNVYEALRAYNSGSVNKTDLSDGLGATASYVSDCANRLLGVVPN